ncbi:phosphohistidine phosphatase SixA [Synechococcus sp. Nb3U1]|uniref:phosphohistidine phosphatase SixA n=1 Tax=Synechococcus sp. Nb3U1 TaxID=1914529 RepID=UPI001F295144|nr:phosphohistidine phosphatase SixA [Synechococcus sp. Nb3U1]MCF2969732.1 phosphohistidine phosphatase SixA [Synechococcus sp. Nb3U1]
MVSEVEHSDEHHNAAEIKNSLEALSVDFIRHGIAEEPQAEMEDAFRALTDEGRKRCRKIARQLKEMGWKWNLILTSPLVRARQTAEIFSDEGLTKSVEVFEPLAPGGSFADLVRWQTQQDPLTSLASVGHQPDLSLWVQAAIGLCPTNSHTQAITLKKAGLAQVRFLEGRIDYRQGSLTLLLSPKVLLR